MSKTEGAEPKRLPWGRLVWNMLICPWCGEKVSIGLMSLVGRCGCGAWYGDTSDPAYKGWHKEEQADDQA